ncbi:MAG: DNA polymerase II large subunit, partial [Promethearchaeota archaeon]
IKGWEWLEEIKKLSHTEDGVDKSVEKEKSQKEGEYGGGLYSRKQNKLERDDSQKNKEEENQIAKNKDPVKERRKKLDEKIPPVFKYIADVIAGRPVFAYPSYIGGHRIRYGRSRNTGLAACGMNPNTMYLLNEFIAVGTQLKIERPGKSTSVLPVSSIEGPVCLLENGDVVQFNKINSYKITQKNPVKKILFLGDILFGFGEFAENNHKLIPSGYVEEWWSLELEQALKNENIVDLKSFKKYKFKSFTYEDLKKWIDNPFDYYPNGIQTLELCRVFKIPLHPKYTFHYGNANGIDLLAFRDEIRNYYKSINKKINEYEKLRIPNNKKCRNFLYDVFCPHKNKGDYLEIEKDLTLIFIEIFAFNKEFSQSQKKVLKEKAKNLVALEVFPFITSIQIRDKAPYYMGTRMGRPEKAKERKMKPPVHLLFPLGHDIGNLRIFQSAMNNFNKEVQIAIRECPKCLNYTFENFCRKCKVHTNLRKYCPSCKKTVKINEDKCPTCGSFLANAVKRKIEISQIYNEFISSLKISKMPSIKAVKGLSSEFKMPEPIEKGILRALNNVWVFKDGTIRFDAIDVPFTHFTPKEIDTSIEKLKELGYTHDYLGNPLENEDQICELKVQDILITNHCAEYFFNVAKFVDDELEYIYNMPRFYNLEAPKDLVGHYFAGLAPHTSAAIIGRVIGFTPANVGYGHPFWHAAKRRNSDGDEDGLILLLDLLLNFSRFYLPSKIGGKMDAPLVLSVTLDPNEIDSEAFNVDTLEKYPLEFYQHTLKYEIPSNIENKMGLIKSRLKTPKQYEGIKFTHPTININYGPKLSIYKRLESMDEKIELQLDLALKIKAVDAEDAVRKMLRSHFTPDILGNLRKFSTQTFRCPSCQQKYRRPPLVGKCTKCGGNLILTVSKGNITKYLDKALKLSEQFDLGNYVTQRMKLIYEYIQSLTDNPKIKQMTIMDFYS